MSDSDDLTSLPQCKEIDRIADEFERALRQGQRPSIEAYLEKNPDLGASLLKELLAFEVEFRRSSNEQPTSQEYIARFPLHRAIVESIFSEDIEMLATTKPDVSGEAATEESIPKQLGRFVNQRILGRGGFGVVYLAHDPTLNRFVALKVPRRERFTTPEQVASFIQEARTAAKLKHEFLVSVYDVQELDGLPFIVQEYIDGENLAAWTAKNQPTFQMIANILIGISEALSYAHQQELTHCDLKLANVLMDKLGQPHVADFGLAIHQNVRLRHKGERFGTPSCMAPEQVRGEGHRLDGRTDIWAMGVMMYELLVSRRPFRSDNPTELFNEIETLDPLPPRQIDRKVPRELERICLKCLSKRRTDRYSTTDDLREELQLWLGQESTVETPHSSTAPASALTLPDSDPSSKPQAKIIPKGLRSFDAGDADFFLQLLPGPRDRDDLPESIRFWKTKIEETDADKTFTVGLIYGPSGCGKSSLVKAGLLPRLSDGVLPIYVEATAADTEVRILKQLRKHLPRVSEGISLPDAFANLRTTGAGRERKLLVVIDQFEQWLHANQELKQTQLVDSLRQFEGERLQVILLVRDDFFASVHRLFQELECPLLEGSK